MSTARKYDALEISDGSWLIYILGVWTFRPVRRIVFFSTGTRQISVRRKCPIIHVYPIHDRIEVVGFNDLIRRNCSDLWGSTGHQASHRGAAKHGICFASRLVPSNVNSYVFPPSLTTAAVYIAGRTFGLCVIASRQVSCASWPNWVGSVL